jgi:hypothetical protein
MEWINMEETNSSILPVLEGIGRNIDLFGVYDRYDFLDEEDADAKAFESDIKALMGDFDMVLTGFNEQQKNTTEG